MDDISTNIKERVLKIADYLNVSKEKFLESINQTYGNYKGKSKKSVPGADVLAEISTRYPFVNIHWLLTGRGTMITEEEATSIAAEPEGLYGVERDSHFVDQRIPLYQIDSTSGIISLFENPEAFYTEEYLSIPRLSKCDGALFVTGNSMYPLLKSGDIIAYKEVGDLIDGIFWGQMYLLSIHLDEEEHVTIKFVQKSEKGDDYIRLVSHNEQHQDKDVPLSSLKKLALIKASVHINSIM